MANIYYVYKYIYLFFTCIKQNASILFADYDLCFVSYVRNLQMYLVATSHAMSTMAKAVALWSQPRAAIMTNSRLATLWYHDEDIKISLVPPPTATGPPLYRNKGEQIKACFFGGGQRWLIILWYALISGGSSFNGGSWEGHDYIEVL